MIKRQVAFARKTEANGFALISNVIIMSVLIYENLKVVDINLLNIGQQFMLAKTIFPWVLPHMARIDMCSSKKYSVF